MRHAVNEAYVHGGLFSALLPKPETARHFDKFKGAKGSSLKPASILSMMIAWGPALVACNVIWDNTAEVVVWFRL